MPPGDLAGILGCSHQKAGTLARRMYRAGMLEKIPSPMDARYPIWRLPVPSNQPPPAPTRPAPPTPGIHIPMTDDSARELRKLKRESEAKSAGIDDEDLRWMAYYRAQAAQRQQRRQSV